MKYDDMGYKNADWKSDKALISEAYEDLYKVYADRNQKLQEGRSSEALRKKAEERKDNQEHADREREAQQRRNDADPQELPHEYQSTHPVSKESISGNPRTAHTDEENEEYDREKERKAKQKKAEEKKAKEDKWNEVGQAIASNYDDFGIGAFEESQREMTINELWALCGTGEEVCNESGDPTNELKAKVGDTVYFTWNYRPDDPNSCRTLRNAKII